MLALGFIFTDDQQRRLQLQVARSAARDRVEYRGEFEHFDEADPDFEHHGVPYHHWDSDCDRASDGFLVRTVKSAAV